MKVFGLLTLFTISIIFSHAEAVVTTDSVRIKCEAEFGGLSEGDKKHVSKDTDILLDGGEYLILEAGDRLEVVTTLCSSGESYIFASIRHKLYENDIGNKLDSWNGYKTSSIRETRTIYKIKPSQWRNEIK